jgi:hypothetical protein
MLYDDVVVLVPGFFGFGRLGDFFYFADRVGATLRGAIEARVGRAVPVLSIASEPASSLASRQKALLAQLHRVDSLLEGPARYHLVGHSAGGVDADLLTMAQPLCSEKTGSEKTGSGKTGSGQTWEHYDSHGIRARIRSITTIASPHHGTNLSNSSAVGFLRDPLHHLDGAAQAARLSLHLAAMVAQRSLTLDALAGVAQSGSATRQFLLHLVLDQDLLQDLEPSRMEALRANSLRALFPQTVTFATCAPDVSEARAPQPALFSKAQAPQPARVSKARAPQPALFSEARAPQPARVSQTEARQSVASDGVPRSCDRFFALLQELTADNAASSATTVEALQLLERSSALIIRNPSAHLAAFDAGSSDGVVNTARQILLPGSPDRRAAPAGTPEPIFGGCIVADHADVIGHYDRRDPLSFGPDGKTRPINDGFFRSGAGFGDDQFFKLYERVAEWVAHAARTDEQGARRPPFLALVANH